MKVKAEKNADAGGETPHILLYLSCLTSYNSVTGDYLMQVVLNGEARMVDCLVEQGRDHR